MRSLKEMETRELNGGATYICPFGCNHTGGYWNVYYHCLKEKCFNRNFWLRSLYYGGKLGISLGRVTSALNGFIKKYPKGKHAK